MSPRLTRRQLAATLAAATALKPQTPAPPLPANPEEELKAVHDQNRRSGELLAKFEIPAATEPAVHFKA